MKNYPTALLLICLVAFAHKRSSAQIYLGGFAGPMVMVTQLDGESAVLAGGSAALLIGEHFFIGVHGSAMTSRIARSINAEEFQIGYTQVGFYTGYVLNPQNKFQATLNTYIGLGRLAAQDNSLKDRLLQIGPHAGLQYAATDFMRIEINAGYRITTSANEVLFINSNLRAPFGGLSLKFGEFNTGG